MKCPEGEKKLERRRRREEEKMEGGGWKRQIEKGRGGKKKG